MSEPDNASTWHDGLRKLSSTNPPCPGFRGDDWREIYANTKTFIETRGAEAANKGWMGLTLFGVHAIVGAANVSACGALMLSAEPAEEITTEGISFGRTRFYRHVPKQMGVLVWRFGA